MSTIFGQKLQSVLNELGLAVIRIVQTRTRRGIDVEGTPFKPYSKQYARKREKAGRPTDKVDLKWDPHGGMMQSIIEEVFNDYQSVEVLFATPEKELLAYYHSISGAGKSRVIREFFAVNKDETEELEKIAREAWPEIAEQLIDENIVNILRKLEVN